MQRIKRIGMGSVVQSFNRWSNKSHTGAASREARAWQLAKSVRNRNEKIIKSKRFGQKNKDAINEWVISRLLPHIHYSTKFRLNSMLWAAVTNKIYLERGLLCLLTVGNVVAWTCCFWCRYFASLALFIGAPIQQYGKVAMNINTKWDVGGYLIKRER